MTKICHMTSVHALNDTRIFIKECKTLHKAGYNVTLIVQHDKDEVIDGILIKSIDKPKNRRERMVKNTRQVYQRALECDADIYHFHDPELIPVGLTLIRRGKKVIYDVHEDVPEQILGKGWIPKILRRVISVIIKIYTNYAARKFDAIVGATPHITRQFELINPLSINVNNYPLLNELFIHEDKRTQKEQAVCYVGGISVARGIYNMVNAMEMVDGRLILGGTFENQTVARTARSMSGWSKVDELGFISREEVKKIFAKSVAGLLLVLPGPNVFGALPNKMFEYMSAGIPQITSNDPLWKPIIDESRCGITVDPTKPEQIAEAINYLLTHPAEALEMGRNARKAVEEKYNWEAEAPKLIRLYKELLT